MQLTLHVQINVLHLSRTPHAGGTGRGGKGKFCNTPSSEGLHSWVCAENTRVFRELWLLCNYHESFRTKKKHYDHRVANRWRKNIRTHRNEIRRPNSRGFVQGPRCGKGKRKTTPNKIKTIRWGEEWWAWFCADIRRVKVRNLNLVVYTRYPTRTHTHHPSVPQPIRPCFDQAHVQCPAQKNLGQNNVDTSSSRN